MNENCPLLPDSTVRMAEPADLANVTRAPCSTSRFVSNTGPVMLPPSAARVLRPSVFCCGCGASGRALSLVGTPKFCCAKPIEGIKLKTNKIKTAASNGLEHRTTLDTEHYPTLKRGLDPSSSDAKYRSRVIPNIHSLFSRQLFPFFLGRLVNAPSRIYLSE